MKKKDSKLNAFHKYLIVSLMVVSFLLLGLIYFIGILPLNYFIFATSIFVVLNGSLILWLIKCKSKKKIFPSIISLLFLILMMIGIVYEINTISFLKKLGISTTIQNYSVVVLKEEKYTELKDLSEKEIGYLNSTENISEALRELETKVIIDSKKYSDLEKLEDDLINQEISAILFETSQLSIIKEANTDFNKSIKVIYSFDIETISEEIKKEVDVTNEPFNIYVSGIDTYGAIGTLSRSDVNIVLTVNPITNELHITSIPRDYYVSLAGKNNAKDKLTHAGIYGIEESVSTIEQLLNIDINYYIKVNFSSLIKIVDAIGPIEVYSNYAFTTSAYDENSEPYTFNKGLNILNGKQALAFSRERKSFAGGDRTRNENQEIILEAIIKKCLSPAILTKYNNLLNILSDSFITNLDDNDITKLIKKQLDSNSEWQITSYVLEGTDSYNFTYSYSGNKLYVMEPSQESVKEAQNRINNLFNATN